MTALDYFLGVGHVPEGLGPLVPGHPEHLCQVVNPLRVVCVTLAIQLVYFLLEHLPNTFWHALNRIQFFLKFAFF